MADERRALVVEDDADIAGLVSSVLTRSGFDVARATSGATALTEAERLSPDLVTLDVGLPGLDGVEVCRRIRQASDCYIIMVTARAEEIDRLIGLEVGADDYLTKPFSPRELRARVSALFRRPRTLATSAPSGGVISGGAGLAIDTHARVVTVNESPVELTRTEYDLLAHLARRAGAACSRDELVKDVWGTDFTADSHLVNVHMGNLRRKLGADSTHDWIRTLRGVGYRFDPA